MAPGAALDRNGPVCNAAVENFVHQRHYQSHITKLANNKPTVNNVWSREDEETKQAVRARGKKRQQLNEDRQLEIERENMRMLIRLHEIDRAPARGATQGAGGPPPAERAGSLPPRAGPPRGAGSRAGTRVQEMRRIDNENQHLLRRLRGAKSTVNLRKINKDAQEKEKLMRMRCEHQQASWKADAFITKCASEGRLLTLPPLAHADGDVATGRSSSSRPASRPSSSRPGSRPSSSRPASGSRDGAEGAQSCAATPSGAAPPRPPRRERTPLGGRIPAASRALADALMLGMEDEDAGGADARRCAAKEAADAAAQAEEEEELNADEDLAAAKEAAARAFRAAEAVDVSSQELQYGYGDLVKRAPAAAEGPPPAWR